MSLFGKKERCDCEQSRPKGTCKQCYNRLVIELAGAKVQEENAVKKAEIASRMYDAINNENNSLRLSHENMKREFDSLKKLRVGLVEGSTVN